MPPDCASRAPGAGHRQMSCRTERHGHPVAARSAPTTAKVRRRAPPAPTAAQHRTRTAREPQCGTGRARRICCAGRWPACPRQRAGPGRSRCAPTPGTSPGRWPAPLATRSSASRSARVGRHRSAAERQQDDEHNSARQVRGRAQSESERGAAPQSPPASRPHDPLHWTAHRQGSK